MRQLFLMTLFWGSIPLAYIDPFYGVVQYTLINIIRPEQLLWGGGVGRIFLAAQGACYSSWFINRQKLTPEDNPLPLEVKLIWFLALAMMIVSVYAYDPAYSWKWTNRFTKATMFCFIMVKSINNAKKLQFYYSIAVVWWTLLAMWGIQQKLAGNTRMERLGGSVLIDINLLAAVFILFFPLTYYSIFSRNKLIKSFIGIPSFVIFVIFIIFSSSRGAFLGMVGCLILIFLKAKGVQRIKMIATSMVLVVLLAGAFGALAPEGFFDEYKDRLASMMGKEDEMTGETEREGSSAGRLAMWRGALEVYKNNPEYWITGVGMNCYMKMYINHIDEIAEVLDEDELTMVLYGGKGGKQMHNTYLSVLLGGGMLVTLPWCFLIFYGWYQAHTIPKKYPRIVDGVDIHNYARAIEIGIIGYCLCIMFVNMEFIDFFYWHLSMAGCIANIGRAKLKREELGDEENEEEMGGVDVLRRPAYAR